MKCYSTILAVLTIEFDDEKIDEGWAQENVLQNFPEKIAGQPIEFVKFVAGMVDNDGVAIQARVPKEHILKEYRI